MSTLTKPSIIDPTTPPLGSLENPFRPQILINAAVADIVSFHNLPDVPEELRSHLATYIQRARELSSKDPVMSYWCLHFSAKQGVNMDATRALTRQWLYSLMDAIDKVKRELRDNAHVSSEEAGYQYVESFALRIFRHAEAEDLAGTAPKSAARGFLAAANFFEMLSVFDVKRDLHDIQDKINYATWKASMLASQVRDNGSDDVPRPSGSDGSKSSISKHHSAEILSQPSNAPTQNAASTSRAAKRSSVPPPNASNSLTVPTTNFPTLSQPNSSSTSLTPSPSNLGAKLALPITSVNGSPKLSGQTRGAELSVPKDNERKRKHSGSGSNSAAVPSSSNQKVSEVKSLNSTVPKPSTSSSAQVPSTAPPKLSGLPKLPASALPTKSFFSAISRAFGNSAANNPNKDGGGGTPSTAWSTHATPGTEDHPFRLTPFGPPLSDTEKEKGPSPLSGKTTTMTRTGLGGNEKANERGRERGRTISDLQPPSSSSGLNPALERTKAMRASSSSPPPHATHSKPRQRSNSTSRERPSVNSAPSSALKPSSSTTKRRRSSEDRHDVKREDVFPAPHHRASSDEQRKGGSGSSPPSEHVGVLKTPNNPPRPLPFDGPVFNDRISAIKKVHFTGSVKGGLSSVASTSPPPSPPREQRSFERPVDGGKAGIEPLTFGSKILSSSTSSAPARTPSAALLTPATATITSGRQNGDSTFAHSHQRSQSDSKAALPSLLDQLSKPSRSTSEDDALTTTKRPAPSPKPSPQSLPIPIPQSGRARSQSIGYPSTIGSNGSYSTSLVAPTVFSKLSSSPSSKVSPRAALAQLPPSASAAPPTSDSPSLRPDLPVPPISMTLPALQAQASAQQQPTPSPTPPKSQFLSSPSKAAALLRTANTKTGSSPSTKPAQMPPSPPSLSSKPTSAHPATPYTRPDDLPSAMTREIVDSALRHAQYAISALSSYDIEAARRELRQALSALE